MKKYLIAAIFLSAPTFAFAAECGSVWIYKDHVPCQKATNGYDLKNSTVSSVAAPDLVVTTHGHSDANQSCAQKVAEFNLASKRTGEGRELKSVTESSEKDFVGNMTYTYNCKVEGTRFALNATGPDCPLEADYKQRGPGDDADLPENATCLSCDPLNVNADAKAKCLIDNVQAFLTPERPPARLDLRPEDIAKTRKALDQLVQANKTFPIHAFSSVENQTAVSSFLQKNAK